MKLRLIIDAFKYGEWSCGFETRKTWKNKSYLFCGHTYYDGNHFAIHIWGFYLNINYF